MILEKKIFEGSLAIQFYINIWTLGCGQFGRQEVDWQDLSRGPLYIATYSTYKLWTSWLQRRFFSHYKSMGANDPQGVANFDPRGVVGKIYVGDY